MNRAWIFVAAIILSGPWAGAALAEVDVKTPWAKVYVGPGGVFVNGPWGRVNAPLSSAPTAAPSRTSPATSEPGLCEADGPCGPSRPVRENPRAHLGAHLASRALAREAIRSVRLDR